MRTLKKTKGKHEGVTFLSRFQIYREGVTDYTAQSRVTLHTDRRLCDVSVKFVLLLSDENPISLTAKELCFPIDRAFFENTR